SASRYKVIKKLGQGGNGVVELAKDRRVGTLVAIKTLSHSRARNYVPNEVKILDQLGQHANITQYHTAFMQAEKDDGTGKLFSKIVFEYASLGDLHTYINTNYKKAPVPEMFLWHILHEISAGLAHMHSLGIIHGDLKPMNILCLPSPSNSLWPALKIADFGTSVVQPPVDIPRAHMGTMGFIPPESAKFYGPETDIFALGCSIHLVAHKFGPWKEAKSRGVNDRTWLALQQSAIPRNVPHLEVYKTMLVWMGKHDLVVKPLNSWTKGTARRWSKLLNYIMLRALDEQWESRISAEGLMAVVPALQNFALKALQWGHADLLDFF
ncbi:kinase-like protein, partial [Amniculicola lignicola CBS 123094]